MVRGNANVTEADVNEADVNEADVTEPDVAATAPRRPRGGQRLADAADRLRERLGLGQHSTDHAVTALWHAAWRTGPAVTVVLLVLTVVLGLAGPLNFVALGLLVASLVGDRSVVWQAVVFLVALSAIRTVLPTVSDALTSDLGRRVDLYFRRRMIAAVSGPNGTAHLEDPKVRDLVASAEGIAAPGQGLGGGVRGYLQLVVLKLGALGSVALLCQYRWWIGLGVAIGAVVIRRHILTIWFQTAQALRGDVGGLRRAEYVRDVVMRAEAAKESRLFGLGAWLIGRHDAIWSTAMADVWQQRRRIGARMAVVDLAVLVLALLAAIPIAYGVTTGEVGVGQALVLGGALTAIIGLGGFLPDADFPIRYGLLTLPPLRELEERLAAERTAAPAAATARSEPTTAGTAGPPDGDVEFRGVRFHYPRSERPVLAGLDLTVRAGSCVALVGANGAGKTTVVKLLARLHEPTEGTVAVGGTVLADLDPLAWRRRFSAILQDFARYELSARDNVGLGALDLAGDAEALEDAARRAGVLDTIRGLPDGWDTILSSSYDGGVDLSGGQWQRLALARALLAVRAGARYLVLDEPTASLDVRAETEFYDRFLDLTRGVTTILVSHRFGTVRRADRVCVLDGGQVVEDGSHDELVADGGRYARMFLRQAGRFGDE